jgi:hypothetical protein
VQGLVLCYLGDAGMAVATLIVAKRTAEDSGGFGADINAG